MGKLKTAGMRTIQASRKDYKGYINCMYKTDYSIAVGRRSGKWSAKSIVFNQAPTYEQFVSCIGTIKQLMEQGRYDFVYENAEGNVVAYTKLYVVKEQDVMVIETLIVDRNFQLQGYGSRFYSEIEQFAKDLGIHNIILRAFGFGASVFWRKMGFTGTAICKKIV